MVRALVDRVRLLPAPILSESAMWPILAEREVILPDPFAVRIVSRARKGIEARLVGEIEARRYGAIILEFDPSSREGEAMYANAHFTPGVIAAIRAHYRLEADADSMGFVFLPVGPRTGVDTPRVY